MIFSVFKKELKDTLRDKRTLRTMLLIPLLAFPLIMTVSSRITAHFEAEEAEETIKIGLVKSGNKELNNKISGAPKMMGDKKLIYFDDSTSLMKAVQLDSIDFGVCSANGFEQALREQRPAITRVFYKATSLNAEQRAAGFLDAVNQQYKDQRYRELRLSKEKLEPLKITYQNIASNKEMLGKLAGGILPYIFIAFGFVGCMYPAIDLFTGEKERKTIETLLTSPVQRWKLLVGKMGVIVLSGLTAATCSLIGLYFSIQFIDTAKNQEIMQIVNGILSPGFIIMMYALLIPLTIFFAGVMIPITIRAKTFKEAQSIITPLNFVLVLPAMVGFIPGVELNWMTACIPVINVVLSTKELIAGTLEPGLLIISFAVMTMLAAAAVLLSHKQFDRETNILE